MGIEMNVSIEKGQWQICWTKQWTFFGKKWIQLLYL